MEPAALHRDAVVVDAHHDLLLLVAHEHLAGRRGSLAQRWVPELRAGGVDLQVLPVYVEEEFLPEGALRQALRTIDALHVEVEGSAAEVSLCLTGDDIDDALATGKIALVLALEGAEAVGRDIGIVRILHRLGVRMMSLTWNSRTALADGSREAKTGGRLTSAGVAAVEEMERLGMVVDVSHLSEAGFWHVLGLATRPLVASHSNCRALYDHPRNLTDEQLRAVAANGGVVGINLHPMILGPHHASVEGCIAHLEHALEIAGEDCVGLGPDFCGELRELGGRLDPAVYSCIEGLSGARDLPRLTGAMLSHGIGERVVRKVLGENFLRVLKGVVGRRHDRPSATG